jgi:hypothetical protein
MSGNFRPPRPPLLERNCAPRLSHFEAAQKAGRKDGEHSQVWAHIQTRHWAFDPSLVGFCIGFSPIMKTNRRSHGDLRLQW